MGKIRVYYRDQPWACRKCDSEHTTKCPVIFREQEKEKEDTVIFQGGICNIQDKVDSDAKWQAQTQNELDQLKNCVLEVGHGGARRFILRMEHALGVWHQADIRWRSINPSAWDMSGLMSRLRVKSLRWRCRINYGTPSSHATAHMIPKTKWSAKTDNERLTWFIARSIQLRANLGQGFQTLFNLGDQWRWSLVTTNF